MIKVLNQKFGGVGEYIGRGNGSVLGNKFVIGRDGSRDEVVEKYEVWLRNELASGNLRVKNEMNRLWRLAQTGDVGLVCWCAPARCHGDVIKKLIEEQLR